jgi:hypothetical protein
MSFVENDWINLRAARVQCVWWPTAYIRFVQVICRKRDYEGTNSLFPVLITFEVPLLQFARKVFKVILGFTPLPRTVELSSILSV